jgi:hypothetical protein
MCEAITPADEGSCSTMNARVLVPWKSVSDALGGLPRPFGCCDQHRLRPVPFRALPVSLSTVPFF